LKKEQEKKNLSDKIESNTSNIYNPITNPIPFVYKNPNVLRMMAEMWFANSNFYTSILNSFQSEHKKPILFRIKISQFLKNMI
jgi:hypothetical protein